MIVRLFVLCACLALLPACAAELRGTPRILDSGGVVGGRTNAERQDDDDDGDTGVSAQNLAFREQFRTDALAAQQNRVDPAAIGDMMRSGQLLIRLNCDDFFVDAAVLQRDADIGRDMIAPIINILTGIVAIRNFGQDQSDEFLQAFQLGSSAALAGISLIDAHFLFGSENIHEVRELVFEALAAGEEGIADIGTPTFEDAVSQLVDQQAICTPASILMRTREAIAAGRVRPDSDAPQLADDPALVKLAEALGLSGAATPEQAVAVWALYRGGVPAGGIPAAVVRQLQQVGLESLVKTENNATSLSQAGTAKKDAVMEALATFSNASRARLAAAANVLTRPVQPNAFVEVRSTPLGVDLSTGGQRRRVRLVVE